MENRLEHLTESFLNADISPQEEAELKSILQADSSRATEFGYQLHLARHSDLAGRHDPLKARLRMEEARLSSGGRSSFRWITGSVCVLATALVLFFLWKEPKVVPSERATAPSVAASDSSGTQPAVPVKAPEGPAMKPVPAGSPPPRRPTPFHADPDSLLNRYFKHFPNKVTIPVAGVEDTIPQAVAEAFRYYDERKYHEAAPRFKNIVQDFPTESSYKFYYGVSLIGDKQYKPAIDPLQYLTRFDNEYRAPSKYFMALAFIGTGRYDEAKRVLSSYLGDAYGGQYRNNAKELLRELPQ